MDLITLEAALSGLPGITAAQQAIIPSLISAASEIVERWCNRRFYVSTYDEMYNHDGSGIFILNNFPVVSIERIASGLASVMTVKNTDTTNYRSTISVDNSGTGGSPSNPTGVILTRWFQGGSAVDQLDFADYPSLGELGTAINSAGNGWTASVESRYASWACSDLRPVQGSFGTTGNIARLRIFVKDVNDFFINQDTGELRVPSGTFYFSVYEAVPSTPYSMEPSGFNSFRIVYRAGFTTVPYGVQQAVVLIIQSMFQSLSASSIFTKEKLFDYEYEIGRVLRYGIPQQAQNLLSLYRDFRASGEY